MSYLEEILQSAQGGQLVANLAQRFGLTDEQMDSAVTALAPALEIALSNASEEPAMFQRLLGDIAAPGRAAAFYEAGAAHDTDSVAQSRQLLDDLFGSPAAAGQIVQVAARQSGLRPDILSQLLPVLAARMSEERHAAGAVLASGRTGGPVSRSRQARGRLGKAVARSPLATCNSAQRESSSGARRSASIAARCLRASSLS